MNNLLPGTVVSVSIGLFRHVGIVSDRRGFGSPYIISCSRRAGGVAEESAETFANGATIRVDGYPGALHPFEVLARARTRLGSTYDLFNWNCEHFVRWAHGLKQESPQLQAAGGIGLCALGLFFVGQRA